MENSSKLFDINYKLQFLNNYMQSTFMQLKNGKKPTYDFEFFNGDGTPK